MFNLTVCHCVCFKGTRGASGAATIVLLKPSAVTSRVHTWLDVFMSAILDIGATWSPRDLLPSCLSLPLSLLLHTHTHTHTHTRLHCVILLIFVFFKFSSSSSDKCFVDWMYWFVNEYIWYLTSVSWTRTVLCGYLCMIYCNVCWLMRSVLVPRLFTPLIVKYLTININKPRQFPLFEADSLVIDPWFQGGAPKLLINK